ncbi:MAG: histidine phosphatase family protein [Bacteroidales bacterium]|nr:histidine phosphatase family protein [Bacteroidales bacterium]
MKRLLLTRHAKTINGDGRMRDFDRYLTTRGLADIKLVAKELIDNGNKPELIISSPAKRAMHTAEFFAEHFHYPVGDIKYLKFLYGYYSAEKLLEQVEKLGRKAESVMIIAHNPAIAELGSYFTGIFNGHMPTASLLVVDFGVNSWEYVSEGSGILRHFIYPRELRE